MPGDQLPDHPFAPSGTYPASDRHLADAVFAEDPDAWLRDELDGYEVSAVATQSRQAVSATTTMCRRGWEAMNGRAIGDVVGSVLLMVAFAALVSAAIHIASSM